MISHHSSTVSIGRSVRAFLFPLIVQLSEIAAIPRRAWLKRGWARVLPHFNTSYYYYVF